MSILETAGNSRIFEAKGLAPQARLQNFCSLTGCVLQLEPKSTLPFELVFPVFYHKNKTATTAKTNKTFQANTRQSRQLHNCPGRCGCAHQCMSQSGSMWMLTRGSWEGAINARVSSWRARGRESRGGTQPGALPALVLAAFLVSNKSQMETVWFCFEKLLCHLAPNGSIHVTAKEKEEFLPLFPGHWLCLVAYMEF